VRHLPYIPEPVPQKNDPPTLPSP